MMKTILLVICFAALTLAANEITKTENNHQVRGLEVSDFLACVLELVSNIVGGLLSMIIGLVVSLSGVIQIPIGIVITLRQAVTGLSSVTLQGTVNIILSGLAFIGPIIRVLAKILLDIFITLNTGLSNLLNGLVVALFALPLGELVSLTTLTDQLAGAGCNGILISL